MLFVLHLSIFFDRTKSIAFASFTISFSFNPFVVHAAVPTLIPLVIFIPFGSFGTAFLFTVIFTSCKISSASFPVIFLFVKSIFGIGNSFNSKILISGKILPFFKLFEI